MEEIENHLLALDIMDYGYELKSLIGDMISNESKAFFNICTEKKVFFAFKNYFSKSIKKLLLSKRRILIVGENKEVLNFTCFSSSDYPEYSIIKQANPNNINKLLFEYFPPINAYNIFHHKDKFINDINSTNFELNSPNFQSLILTIDVFNLIKSLFKGIKWVKIIFLYKDNIAGLQETGLLSSSSDSNLAIFRFCENLDNSVNEDISTLLFKNNSDANISALMKANNFIYRQYPSSIGYIVSNELNCFEKDCSSINISFVKCQREFLQPLKV
jgi:hypothetical protein